MVADQTKRSRVLLKQAAIGIVAVGVLAGTFVLGRASISSLSTAGKRQTNTTATTWKVREAEIGRSVTLTAALRTGVVPGPLVQRDGMVTQIADLGSAPVQPGTELLRIDQRPVAAGVGTVPSFRDLSLGVVGDDVTQLRSLLCSIGRLKVCKPNNAFDENVNRAVKAWQLKRGLWPDGVVQVADIMWFPSLPVTLKPTAALKVGSRVTTADRPFDVSTGQVSVEVAVTADQAREIPTGAKARLPEEIEGQVAAIEQAQPTPGEQTDAAATATASVLKLTKAGSEEGICVGDLRCNALVGPTGTANVEIEIEIIPVEVATVVPRAAIMTDDGGETFVVMADRTRRSVTVGSTSNGLTAVTGVNVGDQVRLPNAGR